MIRCAWIVAGFVGVACHVEPVDLAIRYASGFAKDPFNNFMDSYQELIFPVAKLRDPETQPPSVPEIVPGR